MSFGVTVVSIAMAAQVASGSPSATASVAQSGLIPPPMLTAPDIGLGRPSTGHATMRCIVEVTGNLRDCKIIDGNPSNQGFGAATLKSADLFKVKPATHDGWPIESVITIPLRWKLDDSSQTAPAPPPPSSAPNPKSSLKTPQ